MRLVMGVVMEPSEKPGVQVVWMQRRPDLEQQHFLILSRRGDLIWHMELWGRIAYMLAGGAYGECRAFNRID